MNPSNDSAKLVLRRSRFEPVWFLREVCNVGFLTPQQLDVIASVRDHRRTAVTAGNGVGKTWLMARLALWFLYSHPRSKVITTAPTWNQVVNLLWRELRQAYNSARFPLGGQLNKTELTLDEDWFAIGLSTDEATRFQGFHAPRIMVIFDEATGVHPDIWEAAEGVAVGADDRFVAIGNPTDPTCEFKRKEDSGLWNVLRLNGEEHPNVTQGRPVVPGAVTKEWIEERAEEWGGRESPIYRARVRGLWPEQGDDVLIPMSVVEAAQSKWTDPAGKAIVAAGCDIARFGDDETITIPIHEGGAVGQITARRGQNLMATAGELVNLIKEGLSPSRLGVDDAGLGGGVTDRLTELGYSVVPVVAGSGANQEDQFVNRRAEIWWALREALRAGDISLPRDNRLAGDLTNLKFTYDSRGRVKLESKADLKKRIKRSPDRGDALTIANWVRVPRGGQFEQGRWVR